MHDQDLFVHSHSSAQYDTESSLPISSPDSASDLLGEAVHFLHQIAQEGVTLVDHHTASRQFVLHQQREQQEGRCVYADWGWIVPPISGSITPVFHRLYINHELRPNFFMQDAPWILPKPDSLDAQESAQRMY